MFKFSLFELFALLTVPTVAVWLCWQSPVREFKGVSFGAARATFRTPNDTELLVRTGICLAAIVSGWAGYRVYRGPVVALKHKAMDQHFDITARMMELGNAEARRPTIRHGGLWLRTIVFLTIVTISLLAVFLPMHQEVFRLTNHETMSTGYIPILRSATGAEIIGRFLVFAASCLVAGILSYNIGGWNAHVVAASMVVASGTVGIVFFHSSAMTMFLFAGLGMMVGTGAAFFYRAGTRA
jgi:hypothetical protein